MLERGGVIGGSSAGATIQGEYLVRGNPLGNWGVTGNRLYRNTGNGTFGLPISSSGSIVWIGDLATADFNGDGNVDAGDYVVWRKGVSPFPNSESDYNLWHSQFGQAIQSQLFSKVVSGVYDIPALLLTVKGVYTNTAPVDAYRGAGRPEATYVVERIVGLLRRAGSARIAVVPGWIGVDDPELPLGQRGPRRDRLSVL
ncbi:MAG: molybdopterin-dependent oxidoreductase, partial [Sphingopyxis sp.]|nr:molybdopterin-dependent oxidoreductase [Sphingopyxis sp.]